MMTLQNSRVVLTGASGGIGAALAQQLASQGAAILLVGRQQALLQQLSVYLQQQYQASCWPLVADVTTAEGRAKVFAACRQWGGVDLLINNAGISDFASFESQQPERIESIMATNLLAPMLLTHQLLPLMREQSSGRIVNVGSTFGSIGFAWFASYSSSKFGLRGFSEALRRELDGSGIGVSYFAPRAVRTAANRDEVYQMAELTGMNMDEPADVAVWLTRMIVAERDEAYFGWPEKLFVKINALWPGLVSRALRKNNRQMEQCL